jgi:hypothetical protein
VKRAAVAVASVALVGALSACDPGPECAQWSTTLHTSTTVVNGKVSVSTVPVTVCVRYVEERPA